MSFYRRYYRVILCAVAGLCLTCVAMMESRLWVARNELGILRRDDPFGNKVPPVLQFTTVALGGFRGLIANALWVRAVDLQDDGKYFEMVQLSDWITKLQPNIGMVWVHLGWNMAYNISIKFQNFRDRWLWVSRAFELLRDEGLRYNPKDPLIYRELAWIFQHKIGQNMDDAHLYFKEALAEQVSQVIPQGRPDYAALLELKTPAASNQVHQLRQRLRFDPRTMKAVDDRYGPFDWRLPEAHAIYWATLGLELARDEELIRLRRVIYQSMQMGFYRGRLIEVKFGKAFVFGPNLDIMDHANQAYEDMMNQDPEQRDHIKTAHRNFLRDAVYFLYTRNRTAEAAKWFKFMCEKYAGQPLLTGRPETMPGKVSLDDYCLDRVAEDAGETSMDRTKLLLEGMFVNFFNNLAMGVTDQAVNYELLARKIWTRYAERTKGNEVRIGLPPLELIKRQVLDERLGPQSDMPAELKAQLRTELGLPAATNAPPVLANPPGAATNAVEVPKTGPAPK